MASGFPLVFLLCVTSGLLIEGTWSTRVKRWPGCPVGWRQYGSRCFIVEKSHKTAAAAERHCNQLGGNLASIHSSEESNFIVDLVKKSCGHHATAFIGLYDAIQEGTWLWTDGTKYDFNRWGYGEPNNVGGEHCTQTNFRGHYWNDVPCHFKYPFVCARRL